MQIAIRFTTAALPIVGACNLARREKVQLKLNLTKGDAKIITTNMDMTTKAKVADQDIDMVMKMNMDTGFDVQNVDAEGNSTVGITQKRIQMSMNGGPVNMSFDSDKPDPNNPVGQIMGVLIGKTISMKLDPTGKASDIEGIDKLVEDMQAKAPPGGGRANEATAFGHER